MTLIRRGHAIAIAELLESEGYADPRGFAAEAVGATKGQIRRWLSKYASEEIPFDREYRLCPRAAADQLKSRVRRMHNQMTVTEAVSAIFRHRPV